MIAFAPGAVDAMMLLALALNLDPVYVGAHHLARIFFLAEHAIRAAALEAGSKVARDGRPPAAAAVSGLILSVITGPARSAETR